MFKDIAQWSFSNIKGKNKSVDWKDTCDSKKKKIDKQQSCTRKRFG